MKKILIISVLATCFVSGSGFASEHLTDTTFTLTFVDHLKVGFIEQDVYVETTPGTEDVFRVLPNQKEKFLNSKVYTVANPQHHDPFDIKKAGPYKKGKYLGMTLREWLNASGSATYTCGEGWGTFKAKFKNLVPNATYTLWHFFMPAPPTIPFTGTLDVPIGDRAGTQSVFKTDSKGNATLNVTFEHCLQFGGDQLMSGMAIALHSDGKTYGSEPGAFGQVTHVQLFAILPNDDDVK